MQFIFLPHRHRGCWMSCYFINVYIINRILHARLRRRILSSSVQVHISVFPCAHLWDIDLNTRRLKFISASGHVIFCLSNRHRWKNRTTSSRTNLLFFLWQIINFAICLRNKPPINPFALLFVGTIYIEVRSSWFENSTLLFKTIDLWIKKVNARDAVMVISYWLRMK